MFGPHDQNIKYLESLLSVRVGGRGAELIVEGDEPDVAVVERILKDYGRLFNEGRTPSASELRGKIRAQGMRLTHTHHAHALHSPFWWLKCAVGVERTQHPAVSAYHKLLVWDMMSAPRLTRTAEALMDPLIGKGVALYFTKPARTPSPAADIAV